MALSWLCIVTISQGQPSLGRRYAEEGVKLARASGDRWLIGLALSSMGVCARWQGHAEAAGYFRKSAEAFRDMGDWRQMAALLLYLAEAVRLSGKLAEAQRYLEGSLAFAREHRVQQLEAWPL